MKISDKREQDLYNAIAEPVMDLRLESQRGIPTREMDEKLFKLQGDIWNKVILALGLKATS